MPPTSDTPASPAAPAPVTPPKKSPPRPAAAPRPLEPEPELVAPSERVIAVRSIAFAHGQKVDVPGKAFAPGVTAGPTSKGSNASYRLTYYPDRRHHLVEYSGPGVPLQRRWIPESWCTWEPAS